MHNLLRASFCCLLGVWPLSRAQTPRSSRDWQTIQTIAGGIQGVLTAPPANLVTPKFTSGALMGNGDIGVVAGSSTTSSQTFWFGKSDSWATHWNPKHNAPEVSILSLGTLTPSSQERTDGADSVYKVEQQILKAQVLTTLKLGASVIHLRSWTADNGNVFVTEVSSDHSSTPVSLRLQMPGPDPSGHMVYPSSVGTANGVLWAMDASFSHLRAKSAFLVSSEQRSGRVTYVDITSEQSSTLTVRDPWGQHAILIDGHRTSPNASGQITMSFSAGKTHHLRPE